MHQRRHHHMLSIWLQWSLCLLSCFMAPVLVFWDLHVLASQYQVLWLNVLKPNLGRAEISQELREKHASSCSSLGSVCTNWTLLLHKSLRSRKTLQQPLRTFSWPHQTLMYPHPVFHYIRINQNHSLEARDLIFQSQGCCYLVCVVVTLVDKQSAVHHEL